MLPSLELKLIAGALLLAALAGGAMWLEHRGSEHEAAKVAEATAARAAMDAKVTEQRVSDQARIAHDATVQADAARAAAAASDRAAASLRVQLRAFVAHARAADSAASAAGYPADDPIGVLAEVFGRIDDAAGRYSKEADDNWIGWNACFQSYQSLNP